MTTMAICPKCDCSIDAYYNICTLCYAKSKPTFESNPEPVHTEGNGTLKPTPASPVKTILPVKTVLASLLTMFLALGAIYSAVSYLNGKPPANPPDIAQAPNQPSANIEINLSHIQQHTDLQPPGKKTSGGNLHLINNPGAYDVTYNTLCAFIYLDKTDEEKYIEYERRCGDFAEAVHNNAEKKGIKAAWVGILFENKAMGHAINAFQTTDLGLVFIDCTGQKGNLICSSSNDRIAYVEKGKEYGTISIDKAGSLDYSYYETYKQESQEYQTKLAKYNNEVITYNSALGGRTTLAEPEYSKFQSWKRSMEQQKSMLEELRRKLGYCFSVESMGIVKTVDVYW